MDGCSAAQTTPIHPKWLNLMHIRICLSQLEALHSPILGGTYPRRLHSFTESELLDQSHRCICYEHLYRSRLFVVGLLWLSVHPWAGSP
ncbi:hypothetical protein BKA82DRAFT_4309286 [Pisolithus tinctorius]|nr:hypothetical protein BKA82DRAFT_4309286 [Pisolithus tinctorius]